MNSYPVFRTVTYCSWILVYAVKSLHSFNWKMLSQGLKKTNPILSALLMECFKANRAAVRKPDPDVLLCAQKL